MTDDEKRPYYEKEEKHKLTFIEKWEEFKMISKGIMFPK